MMLSGYLEDFRRGGIESAVNCYEQQLAAGISGEKPLYRPRAWKATSRRRKKQIAEVAWYRPADTVLRVPYTPGSELASLVRGVVQEETARLGLTVRTAEGGGVPLKRSVTTSDLGKGKPCPQGNCPLCLSGEGKGGLHHHRSGAVYKGDCKLCLEGQEPVEARYWGETGRSAYCRTLEHVAAIHNKDEKNAFSKHLTLHHPEEEGNTGAFQFSLVELHNKPLPRLTSESCFIHHNKVDVPMNSKAEWHQPTVGRVVVTRELEELEGQQQEGSSGRERGSSRRRGGGR